MRSSTVWIWTAFLSMAIVLGGCERERARELVYAPAKMAAETSEQRAAGEFLSTAAAARGRPAAEDKAAGATLSALASSQVDRYLIKNARVTIEAEDARAAASQAAAWAEEAGGYVADLRESVDRLGGARVQIQLRVPAKAFQQSMKALEALGRVLDKQVTSEDVTEEFVDTEAKLRNLKRTEERLLEHLDRAGKLEDVLAVERELNRVRGEIERLEGRLRFLAHRVEFSTIHVTMQEKARTQPLVPPEAFSTGKVFSEATRSLVSFGQSLWTRVIWIVVWIPVWVPLVLVAWLAYRRWRPALAAKKAGQARGQ